MRKGVKRGLTICAAAAVLTVITAFPAFAGQWRQDANGWWWQQDDGSCPINQWAWIDGNHDGVAECYYLGPEGYIVANATLGEMVVDANGCMTENGVVQTINLFGKDFDKAFEMVVDMANVQVLDYRVPTETAANTVVETEDIDPYELAYRIVDLVNEERARKGVGELVVNEELMENAAVRAEEGNENFFHTRPDGSSYKTAITVNYIKSSENLAGVSIIPGDTLDILAHNTVNGWLNSSGHKNNMLNSTWNETGVGVYSDGVGICAAQIFIKN